MNTVAMVGASGHRDLGMMPFERNHQHYDGLRWQNDLDVDAAGQESDRREQQGDHSAHGSRRPETDPDVDGVPQESHRPEQQGHVNHQYAFLEDPLYCSMRMDHVADLSLALSEDIHKPYSCIAEIAVPGDQCLFPDLHGVSEHIINKTDHRA